MSGGGRRRVSKNAGARLTLRARPRLESILPRNWPDASVGREAPPLTNMPPLKVLDPPKMSAPASKTAERSREREAKVSGRPMARQGRHARRLGDVNSQRREGPRRR